MPNIDGWHSQLVCTSHLQLRAPDLINVSDTMIDFGFVIGAFVPLVLYWMWVASCTAVKLNLTFCL